MSIEPQFTYDNLGNPIGVFLPITEWNKLTEMLHLDIPDWQKKLIDSRLAEYNSNPENTLEWDDVIANLTKQVETL